MILSLGSYQAINFIALKGQATEALYPYSTDTKNGNTGTCVTSKLNFPTGQGVQYQGKAKLVTPTSNEAALMAVSSIVYLC